uniref:C-type lectin domain-containing protein n=1 Tax=Mola mola TaxID=94237 RepID=A0A3Q4B664_MOLML
MKCEAGITALNLTLNELTENELRENLTLVQAENSQLTNDNDRLRNTLRKKEEEIKVLNKSCNTPTASNTGCRPGWSIHASRCFLLSNEEELWDVARSKCQSYGGDLAVASNEEDQNPQQYFHSAWIGLNDMGEEGVFVWVNGATIKSHLSFWSPGNPNNAIPVWDKKRAGQDCVAVVPPRNARNWLYTWDDITCRGKRHYICETMA